ncbi:hypothetical protein Asulf_02091 [Archaeoglobus sulfaticallidus PM70-1]|uniref:Ribonuclease P protein component 3 n=1 Tax=Archaeoglobus sulfaticallidus PM70-1 TaxID=387631 RepID=N0BNZ1_9EURY|nr:RNase P subunit p30 family protein [Archaeoglobus sulfaticallidus]AGK62050.1 hypothetical protein Asulf_02091 [Archaeoglobus sulfaticallidus PM70-1]
MDFKMDFKSIKPDLLRFKPKREELELMGFDSCLFLTKEFDEDSALDFAFPAYFIECDDTNSLKKELRKASKSWIVAVKSNNVSVIREAISRKKVDLIVDSFHVMDYISLKLCAEKNVAVEIPMYRFIHSRGYRRARLIESMINVIKIAKKHSTNLVLSSGAGEFCEMRHIKQLKTFFTYFGADFSRSLENLRAVIRRYYDSEYLLDGLEIVSC